MAEDSAAPVEGNGIRASIEVEDIWKRPEPPEDVRPEADPGVGLWSRSRTLRIIVWIFVILAAIALALTVSAYLSGFTSIPQMLDWLRASL